MVYCRNNLLNEIESNWMERGKWNKLVETRIMWQLLRCVLYSFCVAAIQKAGQLLAVPLYKDFSWKTVQIGRRWRKKSSKTKESENGKLGNWGKFCTAKLSWTKSTHGWLSLNLFSFLKTFEIFYWGPFIFFFNSHFTFC